MGQLLYFVPLAEGVGCDREYLVRIGLEDRVDYDVGRVGMVGPAGDGVEGVCFCADPHGLTYDADRQTWISPFSDARYCIGFDREDRPTPETLARDRMIGDNEITLADGNIWLIPCARLAPRLMTVKNNGQVGFTDMAVGERLWRHADRLMAYVDYLKAILGLRDGGASEPESPLTDLEMLGIAADGLSVNYRVSPNPAEEVSLLGLITTHNVHDVLRAMVSFRDTDAGAKKNEDSGT